MTRIDPPCLTRMTRTIPPQAVAAVATAVESPTHGQHSQTGLRALQPRRQQRLVCPTCHGIEASILKPPILLLSRLVVTSSFMLPLHYYCRSLFFVD